METATGQCENRFLQVSPGPPGINKTKTELDSSLMAWRTGETEDKVMMIQSDGGW